MQFSADFIIHCMMVAKLLFLIRNIGGPFAIGSQFGTYIYVSVSHNHSINEMLLQYRQSRHEWIWTIYRVFEKRAWAHNKCKIFKEKPYMTEGVRQIPTQCKNQYLLFVQIPNSDIQICNYVYTYTLTKYHQLVIQLGV